MRFLFILTGILATLYGAYWFAGRGAARSGVESALVHLQDDGWDVSWDDLSTRGFPSRFDTTITELSLRNPDGRFGWSGAFVQLFALSYLPNRVILALPDQTQLIWEGQVVEVSGSGLRASAALQPALDLPLDTLIAEGRDLQIGGGDTPHLLVESFVLGLRAAAERPDNSYDIFAQSKNIMLPEHLIAAFGGALPAQISGLKLDAALALDRQLNRHLGGGPKPQIRRIILRQLALDWGGARLEMAGDIVVGIDGFVEGRIMVKLHDWRLILEALNNAGIIPENLAIASVTMAGALANGHDLELPLVFQNGRTTLGPFPLGPAPRF